MIEIFRDINTVKVGYYSSVLLEHGIQTLIRNENIPRIQISLTPVLCIVNDDQHDAAVIILQKLIKEEKENINKNEVPCPTCSKPNPANFDICWSCSGDIE